MVAYQRIYCTDTNFLYNFTSFETATILGMDDYWSHGLRTPLKA